MLLNALQPGEGLHKPECRTAGHHGLGHFQRPLAGRIGQAPAGQLLRQRCGRDHTRLFDEAHALVLGHLQAGRVAMEAALDQQRTGVARLVIRQTEAAVVAHAHAVFVPGVHHDVLGRTHGPRQRQVARLHAREQQRRRRLVHGVDVEQPVGPLHKRPQRGGAAALAAVASVHALVQPLAVQVLVHKARGVVVGCVKAVKGCQIA